MFQMGSARLPAMGRDDALEERVELVRAHPAQGLAYRPDLQDIGGAFRLGAVSHLRADDPGRHGTAGVASYMSGLAHTLRNRRARRRPKRSGYRTPETALTSVVPRYRMPVTYRAAESPSLVLSLLTFARR
jgi:hypothetical protein